MAKKKLFVSYRRGNWTFTGWIKDDLEKLVDADIFMDYSGIDETDFEHSLLRNLRESDAILLIVTEQTFDPARIHHEKDWVRREIREALILNKPIALACYNGLLPPADLPEDIQAIRGKQGIPFYQQYFKAGIRDLAVFLDKATPIKLQNSIAEPPLPSPTPATGRTPSSHKEILADAISLHEAGQYDRAIELYDQLMAEQYRPKLLSIQELREKAVAERTAEQRRWDAGEIYDEIAALFRVSPERGAEEYAKFKIEFPEFTEDPAGLASRSVGFQKEVSSPPKPVATRKRSSSRKTSSQKKVSPDAHADLPVKVEMECLAILKGHDRQVNSITFNPAGLLLASASGGDLFAGNPAIRLWDVVERREVAVLTGHSMTVRSVAFSPDGSLLASCSGGDIFAGDTTVRLWNIMERREVVALSGHSNTVASVAFSPDGSLLASGSYDNTVRLWDVAEQQEVTVLKGHSDWVRSIAFSPDGSLLASGSDDKTIRLWEVAGHREVDALKGHTNRVYSVAFNPAGSLLASGSWDDTICLWNISERRKLAVLTQHSNTVECVMFSPDGRLLASGGDDQTVRLWGFK